MPTSAVGGGGSGLRDEVASRVWHRHAARLRSTAVVPGASEFAGNGGSDCRPIPPNALTKSRPGGPDCDAGRDVDRDGPRRVSAV
jgi:hypothetical protein